MRMGSKMRSRINMSKTTWTSSKERQLIQLYNAGCSLSQCAKALDFTEDKVSSKLTRLRKNNKLKPKDAVKEGRDPALVALQGQNMRMGRQMETMKGRLGNWNLLAEEFATAAGNVVVPKQPTLEKNPRKAPQDMVALFSDTHAGSRWRLSLTDGYSAYSFNTFCCRMAHYAKEIVNIALTDRPKYGLNTLHIDSLGDTIQGVLRVEDEVTNEFQIVPAVANTTSVLFQWIVRLSEYFSNIVYTGKSGNHGRMTQKTEASRSLEVNFDTLINLQLRALVSAAGLQDRISVNVPDGQITTISRLGHRIRLMHGCTLSGGGGIAGLPLFSIARDMLRAYRKEVRAGSAGLDVIEFAHFHTPCNLHNTVLMNGCICGVNPWAFNKLGATDPPSQKVYFTGERHPVGWALDLGFDDIDDDHGFAYDEIDAMFAEDYYDFKVRETK